MAKNVITVQTGRNPKLVSETRKGDFSSSKTLSKTVLQKSLEQPSSSNTQIVLSQTKLSKKSSFITKQVFQNITSVEQGFYDPNPFLAIQKFFGKNWFYKPWDPTKTLEYYQNILKSIGSATFKHFAYFDSKTNPSYSTYKILKVLCPSDWEQDLSLPKSLPLQHHSNFCKIFNY